MRIGYFTETYYPTPDGVSHYLRDIKKELESMGHDVFIFSLTGDKTEKNVFIPMTVPLVMYPQYKVPVNFIPFRLFRLIKKLKLDMVHIQDSFFYGFIGLSCICEFKNTHCGNLPHRFFQDEKYHQISLEQPGIQPVMEV